MKDDLTLSLFLDGRLPPEDSLLLERRLAAEPELARQLDRMRRMQDLSAGLPGTAAGFTPEQVRIRAGSRSRPRWRWSWVAAAALLLAVSHGGAYLFGVYRAPAPSPITTTERLLEEAADLDASVSHERLRARLVGLREEIEPLPRRLAEFSGSRWQRRRARELSDALSQLEIAFDQVEDPGFLGLIVKEIAVGSLEGAPEMRFVPANARAYGRVIPLRDGRFRIYLMDPTGFVQDEGTLEELQLRHLDLQLIEEKK